MNHFVHFLSRERKRNPKKTPIRRGPALLGKGALSATRYAQTALRFLRPFLRCSARLKGEDQTQLDSQPLLRKLPDASNFAGGASLGHFLYTHVGRKSKISPVFPVVKLLDRIKATMYLLETVSGAEPC
jgi:hypothetical protein